MYLAPGQVSERLITYHDPATYLQENVDSVNRLSPPTQHQEHNDSQVGLCEARGRSGGVALAECKPQNCVQFEDAGRSVVGERQAE